MPPNKPGNTTPELHTDDIKAIITSDTEKGSAAKLHNEPSVMMMTQSNGADNPVPVADYP